MPMYQLNGLQIHIHNKVYTHGMLVYGRDITDKSLVCKYDSFRHPYSQHHQQTVTISGLANKLSNTEAI